MSDILHQQIHWLIKKIFLGLNDSAVAAPVLNKFLKFVCQSNVIVTLMELCMAQ